MRFFLIFQGSFNPKIRFLGQKVCPVALRQMHTHRVTTVSTLSGYQDFFPSSYHQGSAQLCPIMIDGVTDSSKQTWVSKQQICAAYKRHNIYV